MNSRNQVKDEQESTLQEAQIRLQEQVMDATKPLDDSVSDIFSHGPLSPPSLQNSLSDPISVSQQHSYCDPISLSPQNSYTDPSTQQDEDSDLSFTQSTNFSNTTEGKLAKSELMRGEKIESLF